MIKNMNKAKSFLFKLIGNNWKVDQSFEFDYHNEIWNRLALEYLVNPKSHEPKILQLKQIQADLFNSDKHDYWQRKLQNKSLEDFEIAVLLSTFENWYLKPESITWFASMFKKFEEKYSQNNYVGSKNNFFSEVNSALSNKEHKMPVVFVQSLASDKLLDQKITELDKKYSISKFELNKYVKPMTNEYEKKSLSKRWVEILGNKIQRDLYSAFLIKNVKENLEEVNIEKAQKEFKNFVNCIMKKLKE